MKEEKISKKDKKIDIEDKKETESSLNETNKKIKNEKKGKKKSIFQDLKKKINKTIECTKKRLKLADEKFNSLELVLLVIISFVFGIFISEAFVLQIKPTTSGGGNNIITSINHNNEIDRVYNTIVEKYYTEIDTEELKEAAIDGMMNYLGDNYSIYYDEEEKNDFEEELNGKYVGVGLKLTKFTNQYPIVTEVFENTPAFESDFQVGDYLIKVEGKDVFDLPLDEVVSNIKGELNKEVQVIIKRGEKEIEKKLTTKEIDIPSIYSNVYEDNNKKIGYIYISLFAQNTDEQFKAELTKLENLSIDGLIIDVRNNVGGHLDSVTNILNLFFDKDEVLYQRDKKGKIEKIYGSGKNKNYEVAVLVNESSASASEILASAFKEISESEIIGKKTFGKGTVQQTVDLSSGGMIKITTENWLTSKGNLIDGEGVLPTIEVDLSQEYLINPTDENDTQLQKAIDILKDK